ncbi:MAG: hypothetical protein WD009_02335 [Phycisphaeraceae bacterium]
MTMLPRDISFDHWLAHVFDHPVPAPGKSEWWFSLEIEDWDAEADPSRTVRYLTLFFRKPEVLTPRFSRGQIDQGLDYLVSPGASSHMHAWTNTDLPWPPRRTCIGAMYTLYEKLIAPVYGNDLASADHGDVDRRNYACHMWWDVIPLWPDRKHPDYQGLLDAVLGVFRRTLELESEACLESVLHGLGHWHHDVPERTEPIVRNFLRKRRDISPELREYAERAAVGQVN